MTARASAPRSRRSSGIRSMGLLRALAAGITLLSFGAMTAYAGSHVQNPDAPLKPAVAASPVATPAPAVSGRTRLTPGVTVTGRAPITRTRAS